MTVKLLVPKHVSSHDSWLQKMQALCLDAYAPLIALLNEQANGNQPSPEELTSAVQCSLKHTGNVFARLTKERQRNALMVIHKDLTHMADEEFKATDVLFGEDVVDRIKKRHEALRTLRKVKQPFQKVSSQKSSRFGRRENQGYKKFDPGTFKKARYNPPQQKGHTAQNKRN